MSNFSKFSDDEDKPVIETKKREDITKTCKALSLSNLVVKSNALLSAMTNPLSLSGYRMFDTYLSRLNLSSPDKTQVVFAKKDFERIFDIKRIRTEQLLKTTKELFDIVVDCDRLGADLQWTLVHKVRLFDEVIVLRDEYGNYFVQLDCSQKAKPLLFDINGYVKYQLKMIVSFRSEFSIRLYLYICQNAFRKKWSVSIDALKKKLCCDGTETYEKYKYFNKFVLKKAHEEINEKSNITFDYVAVYRGNRVEKIEFSILCYNNTICADTEFFAESATHGGIDAALMARFAEITENTFTQEELVHISNELLLLDSKWLKSITHEDEIKEAMVAYLKLRYSDTCARAKQNSRFGYLVRCIKTDQNEKAESQKQESYDIDELEKINILPD